MQKKRAAILILFLLVPFLAGCGTGKAGEQVIEVPDPTGAVEEAATPDTVPEVVEEPTPDTVTKEPEKEVEYVKVESEKKEIKNIERDEQLSHTMRTEAMQRTREAMQGIVGFGYGAVNIFSEPQRADAFLGGVFVGKTPVTLPHYQIGKYTIKIEAPNYEHYFDSFYLANAMNVTINVTLNKTNSSRILGNEQEEETQESYIGSEPEQARVYIDGTYAGKTPAKVSLTIGDHVVKITKDGFDTRAEKITVEKGRTMRYNYRLVPSLREKPTAFQD